jgi:hypothetical protein
MEKVDEIVSKGLVPTVECSVCHYKHCFFEGSVKYIEQAFNRPCDECGGENIFHGIITEL